ncbi:hypothetical protein B7R77_16980 [Ralstonia solanacearum K60]|uniref:Uncharacterized protein n=1 Tax=Ralstonia solanacearum K60 TaxID=1091042 RepID=A0AAP8D5F6_RALSL|nr:hypothetical protein B7R77_16980 [Ralstonia solanacearum K60]
MGQVYFGGWVSFTSALTRTGCCRCWRCSRGRAWRNSASYGPKMCTKRSTTTRPRMSSARHGFCALPMRARGKASRTLEACAASRSTRNYWHAGLWSTHRPTKANPAFSLPSNPTEEALSPAIGRSGSGSICATCARWIMSAWCSTASGICSRTWPVTPQCPRRCQTRLPATLRAR